MQMFYEGKKHHSHREKENKKYMSNYMAKCSIE